MLNPWDKRRDAVRNNVERDREGQLPALSRETPESRSCFSWEPYTIVKIPTHLEYHERTGLNRLKSCVSADWGEMFARKFAAWVAAKCLVEAQRGLVVIEILQPIQLAVLPITSATMAVK